MTCVLFKPYKSLQAIKWCTIYFYNIASGKLESHSAIASCDSYASFVLSNLPRASITR